MIKHGLLLSALATVPVAFAGQKGTERTVTDIAGRNIACPDVPKRIYLADPSLLFLYASLVNAGFTQRLVAIPAGFRAADRLSYQQYCRRFPEITALPHLPPLAAAQVNTETIVDLRPDIVFTTTGTFAAMEAAGTTLLLERAGIRIIVLDMSIDPLKNTPLSIAIMAKVFQLQEKASEINTFIRTHLEDISSRLAIAGRAPIPVLLERAAGFSEECCYAYGNGNFAQFLTFAGGKNIGADYIDGTYGVLNQETIIYTKPQKVIVTGSNWQGYNPGGDWVGLGPGADLIQAEKQLGKLMQRPAFKTLAAVQKRECYAIWHTFYDSPFGFIAVLKFAVWLHPDLFSDIDPDAVFHAFYTRFLPVGWQPGYWVSLHPQP